MLKTAFSLCGASLKIGVFSRSCIAKANLPRIQFRSLHSVPIVVNHTKMKVQIIPALEDNYMYLIIDEDTLEAAIVDPVTPEHVMNAVKENKCKLTKVLTTHHHWDHAGGNENLKCLMPDLHFYGGDTRIGALTTKVKHGSVINLGNLKIECLHTPCHTQGHICYFVTKDGTEPAVFTGDTLFSAGCGRFFEGTPEEMHNALNCILAKLPDETKVYCGHEYTVNNLKFACKVEPNNKKIQEKLQWAICRRETNCPTIPSTIGEEKLINVFMRVDDRCVKDFTKKMDPVKVMEQLRKEKDQFKC